MKAPVSLVLVLVLGVSAGCSDDGGSGGASRVPGSVPLAKIDAVGGDGRAGAKGGDVTIRGVSVRIAKQDGLFALPPVDTTGADLVVSGREETLSSDQSLTALEVSSSGIVTLAGDVTLTVAGDVCIAGEVRVDEDHAPGSSFTIRSTGGSIVVTGSIDLGTADLRSGAAVDVGALVLEAQAGTVAFTGRIDTRGGESFGSDPQDFGGKGGAVTLSGAAGVLVGGSIDARGGSNDEMAPAAGSADAAGGAIVLESSGGDIVIDATPDISCAGGVGSEMGGPGGALVIEATAGDVSIEDTEIRTEGGEGFDRSGAGGAGGPVSIAAPAGAVSVAGRIQARGGDSEGQGGAGGTVTVEASGAVDIPTGGTLRADGGQGERVGGGKPAAFADAARGGDVSILVHGGTTVSIGGAVTANGGESVTGPGGEGGAAVIEGADPAAATPISIGGKVGGAGGEGSTDGKGGRVRLSIACANAGGTILVDDGVLDADGEPDGAIQIAAPGGVAQLSLVGGATHEPAPVSEAGGCLP